MLRSLFVIVIVPYVASTNSKYMIRNDLKLASGVMQTVHTNTLIECLSQCSWSASCGSVSFHNQQKTCMLSSEYFAMYDDVTGPRVLPEVAWLSGIKLRYGGLLTFFLILHEKVYTHSNDFFHILE